MWQCVHASIFPVISTDLLSVPPGFKQGVSFSDVKEEQGWSMVLFNCNIILIQ